MRTPHALGSSATTPPAPQRMGRQRRHRGLAADAALSTGPGEQDGYVLLAAAVCKQALDDAASMRWRGSVLRSLHDGTLEDWLLRAGVAGPLVNDALAGILARAGAC